MGFIVIAGWLTLIAVVVFALAFGFARLLMWALT